MHNFERLAIFFSKNLIVLLFSTLFSTRKALRELLEKGLIKQVVAHNAQHIYTRLIKEDEEEAAAAVVAATK